MALRSRSERLWGRIVHFVSVLYQTAKMLSALVSILTFLGLGSVIVGYISNILPLIATGLVTLVLSVLLFIFVYTFALERGDFPPDSTVYPPPSIAPVELLLKEVIYQYFPDGQTMAQRKRFRVRALQDGVRSFPDRYKWTGAGKCSVRSLTPGFAVVNERKEEFWDYFDVVFPYPLHVNEVTEFVVGWDLYDQAKSAVPFLSTMIDFDTKHLVMEVVLPPELAPKRAYFYDFRNYIDTLPITTQEVQWDPATQSIRCEVPQPKRYHKYLIRWYSE